jgi:hypothetical protein
MMTRKKIAVLFGVMLTLLPLGGLISSIYCRKWDAATTYATLFVGPHCG